MSALQERPVARTGAGDPPVRPGRQRRAPSGAAIAGSASRAGVFLLSVLTGLVVWELVARHFGPSLVASPRETWDGAVQLVRDGMIWEAIGASTYRIMVGWALGLAVGAPLGLLMGRVRLIRMFFEPYIEFFRFIPPIAFVTLAVIWFGLGDTSKIVLIFYTSVFIVTINTMSGAIATDENKLRAASSLGANRLQVLTSVVLPSTVPYIVTGARLAMGNSFLTIVAAEMVGAEHGLGALIWTSRNFGRIDWTFVAIILLGVLGFTIDRLLRLVTRPLARYKVKF